MKIKRFFSILLAVLMLTSVVSISALAEDETKIAKVNEYLCAPGQYTNNGSFGIGIDGTLDGKVVSLGNFGGYVIYEFNEPVMNSNKHPYGVDFSISGNAFNAASTTQEPGQVWVSQDGENWYALAGSEHYEDETVWDYSLTYKKSEERKCTFSDSLGDSGTVSPAPYPLSENYPKVTIPEDELTLSGILLRKQRTPSISNGISTSFGYVDTHKNSGSSLNPYCENPQENGRDGQFDISWAVDKNGFGVELDYIKYVKVQTATFIDGAIYGEKSTEISGVAVAEEAEKSFGKTKAPEAVIVGETELKLEDGKTYYEVNVDGGFDVKVESYTNVYINNLFGNEKHFDSQTEKGIIRIIVQSDDCEPLIYYINTGKGTQKTEITLSENDKVMEVGETSEISAETNKSENIKWSSSDEKIISVDENGIITAKSAGEADIIATAESGAFKKCHVTVKEPAEPVSVTVSFSVSDGEALVDNHCITVSENIAEEYGYETAKKDHNNVKIEGVTVFDAIVACHEELYGDAFKDNPENYLMMNTSFITKAFGEKASYSGFVVNGTMPNDGIYNSAFGGCTGYACDTALINDGDCVSFFFYQDTKFYSDFYSWFDKDEYIANANEAVTVNISGYCAMYYGINDWQKILDSYAEKLEGVSVYSYIDGEKILLGKTDKNGNADITFKEEGEYTIFAEGVTKDGSPVIVSYAKVNVGPEQKTGFCQWLKNIWNLIRNWFVKVFNFLFGWINK